MKAGPQYITGLYMSICRFATLLRGSSAVFLHLPLLPEHLHCLVSTGAQTEPSPSQPSCQQTELPPPPRFCHLPALNTRKIIYVDYHLWVNGNTLLQAPHRSPHKWCRNTGGWTHHVPLVVRVSVSTAPLSSLNFDT